MYLSMFIVFKVKYGYVSGFIFAIYNITLINLVDTHKHILL